MFNEKGFELKMKTEKTFLVFFFTQREKCFNILFFLGGERKSKKESGEETKTDNENWKLIEEEQEIRKTNYV